MKKLITSLTLMFVSGLTLSQTTVNIEPPLHDAFVYQATPSTNYGSSNNLDVGQGPSGELRMLIKWDLSSLPSCINISNAEIRLNQWSNNNNIGADIFRIDGSWSEASVNWNNQPSTIGWYGTQTFSSSGGLYFIPATNLVNDWLTNGNNGVMFIISWGSNSQSFESKEASGSDPRLIITYTIATPPTAVISSTIDENCGNCDGSSTVSVSGGTQPYNYQWDDPNNQTTPTATGLCNSIYTVIVTDANGCSDAVATGVGSINGPTVSPSSTNTTCGNNNGSVTANASGGIPTYNYSWNNGCNTSTCSNLSAGTYTVTVTDANGCIASGSASVGSSTFTINPLTLNSTYSAGSTSFTINTNDSWTVSESCSWITSVIPTSGSGNSTITVNYSENTSTNTRSCTITVTCGSSTQTVTITQPPAPPCTSPTSNVTASGYTLTCTASGGSGGSYLYKWYNGTSCSGSVLSTSSTYTASTTGYYSCKAYISGNESTCNACGYDIVTGIEEIDFINNLSIYPNPNTGNFVIEMEITKVADLEIKLLNVIGQIIYEEKLNIYSGTYRKEIDLPNIKSGVYYLDIQTEEGIIRKEISVIR